ncbi:protein SHQ1 homolog [Amphibalanus amphitrite]|uniref:protein SHQ1 homolog n=1 Tax=Amphibalanus amphitrite TaxID=1232801 RepID=UPI001C912476|nr:protein SHQ1 homolog [Amphibalanus amphitrite]
MLTPRFTVSQEEDVVIIEIEAPFAHVKDTEVFMEGNLFTFHSSPYYLRLHFSGCIVENEKASAKFDADKRGFVVHAPKVNSGEHFENLDMLTSLLLPKGERNVHKNIEEIYAEVENDEDDVGTDIDWFVSQEMPGEDVVSCGSRYGFANKHLGVFTRLQSELSEVVDVQDPDAKSAVQRSAERKSQEQKDFDDNHYLADMFEEDESLAHVLDMKSPALFGPNDLDQEQKDLMLNLKPKFFKLDPPEMREAGLALVDVMFAFCYERRTTVGEGSVESGWCISKLSSSLSWLERHTSLKETVVTCMRRSLCYPLYRNWRLSCQVLDDLHWLFRAGRKHLVKALLQVHQMLLESEPRYILNQLYIDDMCMWLQQVDEPVISGLSDALQVLTVTKEDVGLDLVELEAAAGLVLAETQSQQKDLADTMGGLALDSDDSEDSESSSDSDDDSSSSDSEETDSEDTDTDSEDDIKSRGEDGTSAKSEHGDDMKGGHGDANSENETNDKGTCITGDGR